MKAMKDADPNDESRPEYDFAQLEIAGRGILAQQYRESERLIRLAPDVSLLFPTDESVNEALRLLIRAAGQASAASQP
jgi:hypothetical protein